MDPYMLMGKQLREQAQALVRLYLSNHPEAAAGGPGIRQAEIFRACGLDWGDFPKALSTQQQYWVVALLKDMEAAGEVERIGSSGPWRRTSAFKSI